MSKTKKAATQPVILNKTTIDGSAFAPFLFGAAGEDTKAYDAAELGTAAALAAQALIAQKPSENIVSIDNTSVKRSGQDISVITLVNDNKPFLLSSVMARLADLTATIYLVAHPIFDIEDKNSSLALSRETHQDKPDEGKRRISLMQIHVNHLDEAQAQTIQNALSSVLIQVESAVRDFQPMHDETQKLIEAYQKPIPGLSAPEAKRVVEFLSWLKNDNFIFLGMRRYAFHKDKPAPAALEAQGAALGILGAHSNAAANETRDETPGEIYAFMQAPAPLIITKAAVRSPVHHMTRLDYIGVKLYDAKGNISGEMRLTGLFTASAYHASPMRIPYLKEKAQNIIDTLGFNTADHSGKALLNILQNYPRDDMFRLDAKTLCNHARLILDLEARPRIRALASADSHSRFVSLLVFVPRDRYDSSVRNKIGEWLLEAYGGDYFEFNPLFLKNSLTRIHYVVHREDGGALAAISRDVLEKNIARIAANWEDHIRQAAEKSKASAAQIALAAALPASYHDLFSPQAALYDARAILALSAENPLEVIFYHHPDDGEKGASLKLFHHGEALLLSQRVPLLENMGFKVIAEQTLALPDSKGGEIHLHDMRIENAFGDVVDLADDGTRLADAFHAIWAEDADNDAFNALTQTAKLNWQQIIILRAYGRYLQQAGIPYSQDRLAQTLNHYPAITQKLYALFELKFAPEQKTKDSTAAEKRLDHAIESALQNVPSLDDDLIIRRFRNLIDASLRTNAYAGEGGTQPRTLAIKLAPHAVDDLPEPKPYREIFVYGPDVEGVHLRMSAVARGGVRWSDRALDYRTEVLGLVKAQQVKNAVIVPGGAKGGFYPHKLPTGADRAIIAEAARQAYITYVSAMLSITDNIINGKLVAPAHVIRHDGDDPYFVVAADKGTASFSDTANAISMQEHFWLDDAFASGGSAGYDHKEMGITARGAWEAVKRHFRETFSRDIQKEPFTAVGVGDMSGDVFGNGMLLSDKTRLVAAFDHRDIFIDPDPNPALTYAERARLFKLPRSSWQDYDRKKLSKGGEIYSRSAKTITLSAEAAKAIGFDKKTGTPFEIITAILQADVDLLWFGGIGTYIRATAESNAEAGDRANDAIRITGAQVRAKIIGEGANLGMTQRGRIEYAMAGGRCNTDAIDNSAGVNSSDLEVNIKIALAAAMQSGKLTRDNRNKLLKQMTPDVSALVLRNNYLQPLALSLAERRGAADLPYQMRFMNGLERQKLLDRRVEFLPDERVLNEKLKQGKGLTRPELSVLMAYAKLTLQDELTASSLVDDSYFHDTLFDYFPKAMREKYATEIENHRLHRDIIATVLANDVINRGGPTFVSRLQDKTGQSVAAVLRAYVAVRDGFALPILYDAIDALDNKIAGDAQNTLYATITGVLFTTTGWMLHNADMTAPLDKQVNAIQEARAAIDKQTEKLFPAYLKTLLKQRAESFSALGAPKALAKQLADLSIGPVIPDIVLVASKAENDLSKTAGVYFALAELLRINKIEAAGNTIPVVDYYDGMALAEANNRIAASLRTLTLTILKDHATAPHPVEEWLKQRGDEVQNVITRMSTLIEGDLNISRFTVAASMIAGLVK